jgi:hypothetical protein
MSTNQGYQRYQGKEATKIGGRGRKEEGRKEGREGRARRARRKEDEGRKM